MIQTDTAGIQRDKNEILGLLLAFYVMKGLGDGLIGIKAGIYPLYTVVAWMFCNAFLLRWFILDAQQRNTPLSTPMKVVLFVMPELAGIFYFFNTRGKEGWRLVASGFLFLFLGQFLAVCTHISVLMASGLSLEAIQTLLTPTP